MSSPTEGDVGPFLGQMQHKMTNVGPLWASKPVHTCQLPCQTATLSRLRQWLLGDVPSKGDVPPEVGQPPWAGLS
jgi:hypothetical protein